MLAGYGHFLRTAASQRWEPEDIGLGADAVGWHALDAQVRDRLTALLAGFCLGEARVAEELAPFAAVAGDPDMAACFEIQAVEEVRHARFFDRAAREVLRLSEDAAGTALRGRVPESVRVLFEERLAASSEALAAGTERLEVAVGLYHMVLEGVVFTAGQLAALELLEELGTLPGLHRGLSLVLRDEHWHVGFGARCLQDLGISTEAVEALAREGDRAAGAWGDAVGPGLAARVRSLHHRRLRAAGLHVAPALGLPGYRDHPFRRRSSAGGLPPSSRISGGGQGPSQSSRAPSRGRTAPDR